MNKRHFNILVLFLGILASCSSSEEKKETKPNVIYILADDLGYGDISTYNPEGKIATPSIDKLASEGVMFTDAHTSSSVCTPTRYGILTGRYNWRSRLKQGVLTGISKALIQPEQYTVARMMKENGYRTAFIGKWHLGWDWALKDSVDNIGEGWDAIDFDAIDFSKPVKNGPKELGFDYSYGHSGSLDMAPYVYVENGLATKVPDTSTVNTGKYSWWREGPTSSDFVHEEVTPHFFNKAEEFIKNQQESEAPFFMYLALPSPHTPILPTPEWEGKSELNPYGDFVMMVDFYVGEMMKQLEDMGIEKNTIVIFTSDNGCSPAAGIDSLISKGHSPGYIYRGHKADIFEGGHRVPFIVRWPEKVAGGVSSEQLLCTTDLSATMADVLGYTLKDDEAEDSYSFLSQLGLNSEMPDRPDIINHSIDGSFAYRKGDWKFIPVPHSGGWSFPKPWNKAALDSLPPMQLYNLADDPSESRNLYAENPELVNEMKAALKSYIERGRSTEGPVLQNDSTDGKWKQIDF